MNLEWPQSRAKLEELRWTFDRRMKCGHGPCVRTVEIWRDAALPPRRWILEAVFGSDPNILTVHYKFCADLKERKPSAEEVRQEKKARDDDRSAVLRKLQAAGSTGCTNLELALIGQRFGARIWELRNKDGFEITRESEGHGVFRYFFRGKKREQQELFA